MKWKKKEFNFHLFSNKLKISLNFSYLKIVIKNQEMKICQKIKPINIQKVPKGLSKGEKY